MEVIGRFDTSLFSRVVNSFKYLAWFTVNSPKSHLAQSFVARNQSYVVSPEIFSQGARNFMMLSNILTS